MFAICLTSDSLLSKQASVPDSMFLFVKDYS